MDLSWLQSDLIGPFYATILLLVLRDRRSFTLVYFRNCAPLISLLLSPLRQKHFTPCFCSGLISVPILPYDWTSYVPSRFSFFTHWKAVRDSFTENFKNDLAWLITLMSVKVRHSLRNCGYIASARCASCPWVETIDHCFLHCSHVKSVTYQEMVYCCVSNSFSQL